MHWKVQYLIYRKNTQNIDVVIPKAMYQTKVSDYLSVNFTAEQEQ